MPNTALKNPGVETPKVLVFTDNYPDPREFLRNGGHPGVSYLYVLSENMAIAQSKGWLSINEVPHFTVRGFSMTIMGRGRPSLTGNPGSSKPIFFIDPFAEKKTGLKMNLDGTTGIWKVDPKASVVASTPATPNGALPKAANNLNQGNNQPRGPGGR